MKKVWKNGQRCQSNVAIDSVLEEKLAVKKTPLKVWLREFWDIYTYLVIFF